MLYPYDFKDKKLQSDVDSVALSAVFHGTFAVSPIAPDVDALKVATALLAAETTLTIFAAPDVARNVTLTLTETAADVAAVQAVVIGTDMADEVLTETMPVFTVNTIGSVAGSKAFKTVTSVVIPAMDGAGVECSVGFGNIAGIPALAFSAALKPIAVSATAITITASTTVLASNVFTLDSGSFDGSERVVLIMMQ